MILSLMEIIDILIIAYAKGEARFSPDQKMEAEDFIQNIRVNWGQFLHSYVKTWMEKNEGD